MKKIKQFISNNLIYIITFLIMVLLISTIYYLEYVIPFGKKSLLTIDFYHQYGPMLGEYYDRIKNGLSLTYSFNLGLGIPIFRNFANYLASPFNLLILLFKRTNLLTSYSIIIGLKPVFAGTFAVYYLCKKFKTKNYNFIPLGIVYGISAYFIAYYWNLMWTDGMVLIPLITLGIEKLINENKYKLYTISLAIMLISNYFIGYMLCIYSVIYFTIYLINKTSFNKNNVKTIIRKCLLFGYASLLSGALAAILLIPLFYAISSISATGSSMPTSQYYACTILDFLKGHFTGVDVTVFASDKITNPNISCGIFSLFLVILFGFNRNINIKEKLCYYSLLLVLFIIFFVPQLDFMMQGFHVPNDLPYRYSFIYSFILIIIAGYTINNLKNIKYRYYILIYLLLILSLLLIRIYKWDDLTNNMIYINMILLTLYMIFITYLYYAKRHLICYSIALILIAGIDAFISISSNWEISQEAEMFYNDYNSMINLNKEIKEYETDLFYRFDRINYHTLSDGAWYGYNAMTTFSSMAYENMAVEQNKLGMPGNYINSYYYVEQTPIYDMMFDIKYIEGTHNDNKRYQPICFTDYCVNQFKNSLGLAYAVNNEINLWNYFSDDPFLNQSDFIEKSTGISDTLTPVKELNEKIIYEDDNHTLVKYHFNNNKDNMYFYEKDYIIDFFIIGDTLYSINDYSYLDQTGLELYNNVDDYNEQRIISILSGEKDLTIYVGYNSFERNGFLLYEINNQLFNQAYDYLNQYRLNITKYEEDTIEGNITLDSSKTIYTSIPYDEGWHVYVDNKEIKPIKIANTLLGFKINEGKHNIKISYQIPKFILGLVLSISSLVLLVFDKYILLFIKNRKKLK